MSTEVVSNNIHLKDYIKPAESPAWNHNRNINEGIKNKNRLARQEFLRDKSTVSTTQNSPQPTVQSLQQANF